MSHLNFFRLGKHWAIRHFYRYLFIIDELNLAFDYYSLVITIWWLPYSNYSNQRKTIFEKICNIELSLLNQNYLIMVETLFFGSNGLNDEENAWIIELTIEYIITLERFITPLLWIHLSKLPLPLKSLIDSGSPYVILFCYIYYF